MKQHLKKPRKKYKTVSLVGPCRHCKTSRSYKSRRLCYVCYSNLEIRAQYEIGDGKFRRRGEADFNGRAPLPDSPTTARPGTPEKMAVMAERAAACQQVFHPGDAKGE